MPPGTSAPGQDDFMAISEMKPLLARSKKEPVTCAFALTSKKEGILLLDKKMRPKQLVAELRKKAGKLKLDLDNQTVRFGRAEVDSEDNPSLLNFIVNKDTGNAVRVKLLEHVKKAGFQKLELKVDSAVEAEPDGADTAPADSVEPPAPLSQAAGAPQPSPTASTAAPESAAPPPDTGALTRTLTDLVKQIPQAGPARQADLKAAALQAQAALKAGNAAGAVAAIEQLRAALGSAPAASPTPAPAAAQSGSATPAIDPAAKAAFTKARLAWLAARKKVETDIASLQKELSAAFKTHPEASKLEAGFTDRIAKMMGQLDEELADKLDEAVNAVDPGRHLKAVGEAKAAIKRYEAFLASDRTLADVDKNPFVPMEIEKTMTSTLSVLSRTIV